MNELMMMGPAGCDSRKRFLATASALALLTSFCAVAPAQAAEDAARPTVWIELGGQLERIDGGQDAFAPSFVTKHLNAPYNVISPLSAQKLPRYGFGGEAKVSFKPDDEGWLFSAAIRYGRSNADKHLHQQTKTNLVQKTAKYDDPIWGHHAFITKIVKRFSDLDAKHAESHAVVDFAAGKDVGLGLLGGSSHSTLSLGVRFAQFQSKSTIGFKSFPDPHYSTQAFISDPGAHHHSYFAQQNVERSFRGIGPSLSLENASLLARNAESDSITFDWGVNAALLFGRQKAAGAHQTSSRYFMGSPYANALTTNHTVTSKPFARSRSKIVPNLGGFAGLSARYAHAKFSLGYRGDFFFGAMDGGNDARDTRNRSFHGPFATISMGLGG